MRRKENRIELMVAELKKDIRRLASPKKTKIYQRFFKTGKGEYGEGDLFLGLSVPQSRKIAINYKDLAFTDIKKLLKSKIHEERLIAVLILVHRFSEKDNPPSPSADGFGEARKEIYDFYLKHTRYINNWDLVDLSADKIVGQYLIDRFEILNQVQDDKKRVQDDVLVRLA
ncbi:MAG: DNA alkylation repair protein, partial [Patescibacteria group bacterium]